MLFIIVGVALKDSLLPEQKGAAVRSCGMASRGAGGKSSLFWHYVQSPLLGVGGITVVFWPWGGRTNSVSLLHRTAASALARRTGHRPQPHRAESGGGEAATAAVCCHGGPGPHLPMVP